MTKIIIKVLDNKSDAQPTEVITIESKSDLSSNYMPSVCPNKVQNGIGYNCQLLDGTFVYTFYPETVSAQAVHLYIESIKTQYQLLECNVVSSNLSFRHPADTEQFDSKLQQELDDDVCGVSTGEAQSDGINLQQELDSDLSLSPTASGADSSTHSGLIPSVASASLSSESTTSASGNASSSLQPAQPVLPQTVLSASPAASATVEEEKTKEKTKEQQAKDKEKQDEAVSSTHSGLIPSVASASLSSESTTSASGNASSSLQPAQPALPQTVLSASPAASATVEEEKTKEKTKKQQAKDKEKQDEKAHQVEAKNHDVPVTTLQSTELAQRSVELKEQQGDSRDQPSIASCTLSSPLKNFLQSQKFQPGMPGITCWYFIRHLFHYPSIGYLIGNLKRIEHLIKRDTPLASPNGYGIRNFCGIFDIRLVRGSAYARLFNQCAISRQGEDSDEKESMFRQGILNEAHGRYEAALGFYRSAGYKGHLPSLLQVGVLRAQFNIREAVSIFKYVERQARQLDNDTAGAAKTNLERIFEMYPHLETEVPAPMLPQSDTTSATSSSLFASGSFIRHRLPATSVETRAADQASSSVAMLPFSTGSSSSSSSSSQPALTLRKIFPQGEPPTDIHPAASII